MPFLILTALTLQLASTVSATEPKTAELWLDKCARCHGDTGTGDTPLGRKLKVVDYSSKTAQEKFSTDYLCQLIVEGKTVNNKTVMPGYKDELSAIEVKELTSYIRGLAK